MKIGIIVPNVTMENKQLEERRGYLMKFARKGTEIVMVRNTKGPVSIESEFEHEQGSVEIVKTIMKLQNDGFDAFIPWCGGDPGIVAGRERSSIPVIGPFQSSCALATILGFSFSIITPETNPRLIESRLCALGLKERMASIIQLNIPVLELREDLQKTISVLEERCQKAVSEDGADAIVFSCMGLFGIAEQLSERIRVPVIDPALAALSMAETVVNMRLTHSPLAYPFPKARGN
jgi:allantoin racemase